MDSTDFLPDPTLTAEERKQCCEIIKATGYVPKPATDNEIGAILNWLNNARQDWPNCMTYEYKDCCFQKNNDKWDVVMRTNDFLFRDLLYKGEA